MKCIFMCVWLFQSYRKHAWLSWVSLNSTQKEILDGPVNFFPTMLSSTEIEISLLSFSVERDRRRQKWTPKRSWETIFGETKRTRRKKIVFPCSTYSPRSGDGEADGPLLLPRLTVERCDRWLDWVRRRSFLLPSWKECFFLFSRNVGDF